MPGRSINPEAYRYGMSGEEKSSEIVAGDYDFGARVYDSRLGRWLSTDPMSDWYPGHSPYCYAGNSSLILKDNDGKF